MKKKVTKFDIKRMPCEGKLSLGSLFFNTLNLMYEDKDIKFSSENFWISKDNDSFLATFNMSKNNVFDFDMNISFYASYKIGKIGFFQGVYSQSNYKQIVYDFDINQLMSLKFANEDKLLRNAKKIIELSEKEYSDIIDCSVKLQSKSFYENSTKYEILKDLKGLKVINKKDEKKILNEFKLPSSVYHYEDNCLSTIYSKIAYVINDYDFIKMFDKLSLINNYFNNEIQMNYKYRMSLSKKRNIELRTSSYNFYFDKEKIELYYVDGVFKGMIIKYAKRKLICIGERNGQYIFNPVAIKDHEIEEYNNELFEKIFILEKEFEKPIRNAEYEKVKLSKDEKIKINMYMYDKFLQTYSYSVEESQHNYKLDVDEKGTILIPKLEIKNIKI